MKFERDITGDVIVASPELAQRFGFTEAQLRQAMRLGLVVSLVESGEGADAGNTRLTLRCGNRQWRAVLDGRDHVTSEEMHVLRGAPMRRAPT